MLSVKYFPRAKNELQKNIPVPKYQITTSNLFEFDTEFCSLEVLLERKRYKQVHRRSLRR